MQLEDEIGAKFFDRSKKQIVLTTAGKFFYEEIRQLLSQLDEVKQKTRLVYQGKVGKLRIGHASSAMHTLIPSLLTYFKKESPQLNVALTEGSNRYILELIQANKLEFAFIPNVDIPEGIRSFTVYRENYLLIRSKKPNNMLPRAKNLKAYKNAHWILPPVADGCGYMEAIFRIFEGAGYQPVIIHESPNTSSVLRMVEEDFGITIMGKSTIKGFDLNIESFELDNIPDQLEMKFVWKASRQAELSLFLDMIFRHFKSKHNLHERDRKKLRIKK